MALLHQFITRKTKGQRLPIDWSLSWLRVVIVGVLPTLVQQPEESNSADSFAIAFVPTNNRRDEAASHPARMDGGAAVADSS